MPDLELSFVQQGVVQVFKHLSDFVTVQVSSSLSDCNVHVQSNRQRVCLL